ncbi:MAG: hypothetical protein WCO68_05095, partial [Verrucomicrobiota bacterium]
MDAGSGGDRRFQKLAHVSALCRNIGVIFTEGFCYLRENRVFWSEHKSGRQEWAFRAFLKKNFLFAGAAWAV